MPVKKGQCPVEDELRQSAVERFLRYVVIDTTSKDDAEDIPSTPGQFTLARLLVCHSTASHPRPEAQTGQANRCSQSGFPN